MSQSFKSSLQKNAGYLDPSAQTSLKTLLINIKDKSVSDKEKADIEAAIATLNKS